MASMDLDEEDDEMPEVQSDSSAPTKDESSVGHLREQALNRKRRLMQLRNRQMKENQESADLDADSLPKPVFRNYRPQSEDLKSGELPTPGSVDLTSYVTSQLEAASAPVIVEEVNLMKLAPRKPDWDLKRGVEKKLQKLERRTQRAIAELIRERLRNTSSDLATVVSQQPAPME